MALTIVRIARSSNLASAAYDPEIQQLQITFQSGRTYLYNGVPSGIVDRLSLSPSPGRTFDQIIKDAFPYEEA